MEPQPERDKPDPLMQILNTEPARIQELARSVRETIRQHLPDAQEFVDRRARLAAYGYSDRYTDLVCTIHGEEGAIVLGLVHAEGVRDPKGLLRGTGDLNRYLVLETEQDLGRPAVSDLIAAAYDAWKMRKDA